MEVLLFFIKWGILFGLFILPLARKGVSSGYHTKRQTFYCKASTKKLKFWTLTPAIARSESNASGLFSKTK